IIYYVHKANRHFIDERELLEYAKVSEADFQESKLVVQKLMPEFGKRERLPYILQKISHHVFELGLRMDFYYHSVEFLRKFWNILRNTKDAVVAGVVMSLAALTLYQDQIHVSAICNELDISMGAVQNQVKNKLCKTFKVSGFTSLVKSTSLIHRLSVKAGVLHEVSFVSKKESNRSRKKTEKKIQKISGTSLTEEDFISFYNNLNGFEAIVTEINKYSLIPIDYLVSIPIFAQVFRINALVIFIINSFFSHPELRISQHENKIFQVFSNIDPPI
ncbi:MAG: hypothetical protein ACOC4M_18100, partial [Promethearchaeia archaeon]